MSLPKYPVFKEVAVEDKDLFDGYFDIAGIGLSEYTFTNLISWNRKYNFQWSLYSDHLLFRSNDRSGIRYFCPISSSPDQDKAGVVAEILDKENNIFIRIPKSVADLIKGTGGAFDVMDDRDNYDYVYHIDELIKLEGKKYDGKRNHIKKFQRTNVHTYVTGGDIAREDCVGLEREWCDIKGCDNDPGLGLEREAYLALVELKDKLSLKIGGIKIDGKIAALAIGELTIDDTIVLHVLKAKPDIDGLYQSMNNEFIKNECQGYRWINFEQDMGIEGLRRSKLSYHPDHLVKKYIVRKFDQ